jgi:tetratricopeptide (TPR) repeat protein
MLKKWLQASMCVFAVASMAADETKDLEARASISPQSMEEYALKKQKGYVAYNEKRYEEAYQILSSLYQLGLDDDKLNFTLGRSAYESGRYEIALAAYERVEMLEPENSRNALELARTQYALQMYEDAHTGFMKVLSSPNLPENVRRNIEIFTAQIEDRLKKSFFYGTFKLSGVYDSNVNFGSSNDQFTLPQFGTFSSVKPKSDYMYDAALEFRHLYDIGEKNGLVVRNQLSVFKRIYDTFEEYDTTYLSYNPALLYQDLKTLYEFNFMFDRMWLHQENYLNVLTMMPTMTHTLDMTTRLIGSFKYSRLNYLRAGDNERDANVWEFGGGYQKLWPSSYGMVRGFVERQREDTKNRRIDVDYNRYRLIAEYAHQPIPSWNIKYDGEVFRRKYEDFNNLFQNVRRDEGYRLGMTVSKKFTPTLYLEGRLSQEQIWSNQAVYGYEKRTCSINLNQTF